MGALDGPSEPDFTRVDTSFKNGIYQFLDGGDSTVRRVSGCQRDADGGAFDKVIECGFPLQLNVSRQTTT